MASPGQNPQSSQNRTTSDSKNSEPSTSDEGFIPLAAKDSEWVGMSFYNPNFKNQETDEEELQIFDSDENEQPPLFLLFPNLRTRSIEALTGESTTNVTKMLIGHKADFSHMKNAKKILPIENKLRSVPELPDEKDLIDVVSLQEQSDQSKQRASDDTRSEPYDIELDDDDKKPKHKKRRKTKSDLRILSSEESSHCEVNITKRPPSKGRLSRIYSKPLIIDLPSSQESFGDDERDEAYLKLRKRFQ